MMIKFNNKSSRVKGLAFHPKRPWVLCSLHSGVVQLWDYRMEMLIDKFEDHDGPVRGVDFHSSQPLFVTGGDDYKIKVWNYQMRRCLFNLLGHLDYIRTVYFHHEYPWILSSSDDQTIRIWNWQSRSCVSVLTGHNHYVMCAKFHPREDLIISASLDQTIRVWDIHGLRKKTVYSASGNANVNEFQDRRSGNANPDLFGTSDVVVKYVLEGHTRGVNWVSIHPKLPLIVSGADDREVKLWRMNETKAWEVDTMRGHINNVSCVLFHPRQELIISNSEDKTIRIWDMSRQALPKVMRRETDRYWIMAAHPTLNLLAAGHDSGMFVFKLQRERPPFDVYKNLFYYKDGFVRQYSYSSGKDVPLFSTRRPTAGNEQQIYRYLAYNSMNNADYNFLLSSDADGGTYELYVLSKDSKEKSTEILPLRGWGRCVVFVSRNRFAALNNHNQIVLRNLSNDTKRTDDLPVSGVTSMFRAGIGRVLLGCSDRFVLYDVQAKKILGELPTQSRFPIKHVLWSRDRKFCAFVSKFIIYIADSNLNELCTIMENTRIKGGAWDADGLFIYTTPFHIMYCLTNGDSGIIRTLDVSVYITAVKDTSVYCLDREHEVRHLTVDNTEAIFKHALVTRRYDEVRRIVKSGKLVGQSIIGYLQEKGFPEVALHFVKDERTRFTIALQCGNIEIALECAQKVNEKECWQRLGAEALRYGKSGVVELCYQQTKDFERLSFFYVISGQHDKLCKMLQIAKARGDNMARFYNALLLGDVEERVRILSESGLDALAFLTAEAHALPAPKQQEGVPDASLVEGAGLMLPPRPIKQSDDWPFLPMKTSYFDGVVEEEQPQEGEETREEQETVEQLDLSGWDDDIQAPAAAAAASAEPVESEPAVVGWGDDLLDALPELPDASNAEQARAGGDDNDYFVMPTLGTPVRRKWLRDAGTCAGDLVAAGSFDLAMQLLHKQIGAVEFAPFKQIFLDVYMFAEYRHKGLVGTQSWLDGLPRHVEAPLSTFLSEAGCVSLVNEAEKLFVNQSQMPQAEELFRKALLLLPLIRMKDAKAATSALAIVRRCRSYILAIQLAQARQTASSEARKAELAALMTQCELRPAHLLLCLYSAIGEAFKIKNLQTAGFFCRRFLEMSLQSRLPPSLAKAPEKVKQVLRRCDQNDSNAVDINFDPTASFEIDGAALSALPLGTDIVKCPYCSSSFGPAYRDTICSCCLVARVGAEADGFLRHM